MKINVEKLKTAQAENCFTNQELCEKANISYSTLVLIKANRRDCRYTTVGKIAKALKIPVNELIERE